MKADQNHQHRHHYVQKNAASFSKSTSPSIAPSSYIYHAQKILLLMTTYFFVLVPGQLILFYELQCGLNLLTFGVKNVN